MGINLSLMHALTFSSLIAAVDPVAVSILSFMVFARNISIAHKIVKSSLEAFKLTLSLPELHLGRRKFF